jgi:hypothetical protein
MSSAILYVAIVAIWACVLIPRWLRRDSVQGAAFTATASSAVPGEAGLTDTARTDGPDEPTAALDGARGAEPATEPDDAFDTQRPAPEPLTAEESRRRMLAARRRLLIMLLVLEAAAITLAVLGLASMWVVIPPSVMVAGYLLLLREAAHADAEQAQREADARAQARFRAHQRAARRATAAWTAPAATFAGDAAATAAALAARLAAAPVAADYEDSGPGRDFAPGLAGKYTPSYPDPDPDPAADDDYDTYDEPRLRAVGD